jgi:hypothetical protein
VGTVSIAVLAMKYQAASCVWFVQARGTDSARKNQQRCCSHDMMSHANIHTDCTHAYHTKNMAWKVLPSNRPIMTATLIMRRCELCAPCRY